MIRAFGLWIAGAVVLATAAHADRRGDGAAIVARSEAQNARRWAQCIVDQRSALSRQYLSATEPAQVRRYAYSLFRDITCYNGAGHGWAPDSVGNMASGDVVRGQMAERLIGMQRSATPLAAEPLRADYSAPWNAVSGRDRVTDAMSMCVASTQPDALRLLLAAQPESTAEAAAFARLQPALSACLQTNMHLSASRQAMRAALAEALYHRVEAKRGA